MARLERSFWSAALKISLSALVPVYNGQSTVGSLISQLLDLLSELTDRFELVAIDNGSTDATAEVIADLALLYPQLCRVVMPRRADRAAVLRTGLEYSTGDIVLARGQGCATGLSGLTDLWRALRLGDIAVIRPQASTSLGSIPALPSEQPLDEPDWQMAQRCVLDGWLRTRSNRDWAGFLAARGFAIQEIDPRSCGSRPMAHATVGLKLPAAVEHSRPHIAVTHGSRPTRRPNYLDR